ncbi:MAG TPA: AMP-binding protein [Acidimicrobiales bacterium]|nr:AMP-binding protein [Acidimicrobiales bacterium]
MAEFAFADVWEAVARARGEATAQVQGGRRFTWTELDRRADALAAAFLASGVAQQDKVANYLYNGPEYVEALFGTLKAGLVPVNTNYRYGPDELTYLWDNADAVAVVFDASFADLVDHVRPRVPRVRLWLQVGGDTADCAPWAVPYEDVASRTVDGPVRAAWGRSPDDQLFIYTGGTTGMPKGVMWRQGTLGTNQPTSGAPPPPETLDQVAAQLSANPPVVVPACPLMHATGLVTALATLRQGGSIVTLEDHGFDPVECLDAVARERVVSMSIVGDVFARPLVEALDREPSRWDLSSLRAIFSSGVMWSEPVKQGLLKHKPSLLLFDSLGSSEAMGIGQAVSTGDGVTATASFRLGETTRVVTDDGRDVVPGSGEVGMLARSGMIPEGYYKDEAKTAATFRVIDGERYVIPGDFASVEQDGTVRLLGRGSQCINTGGEKVFSEEVEEVLKLRDDIADAAVVGVPDPKWGEAVSALVEPTPGAQIVETDVIDYVKARLAHFKAPKRVFVVASIGRAPSGKLDYRRLRADAVARYE